MYVYSKYRNPTWLLPLFISYLTTGNCEHPSTKERQLGAVEIHVCQFYYYVKKRVGMHFATLAYRQVSRPKGDSG